MAAETKEFQLMWEKSPHYRFIQPNSVTVTGTNLGDGPCALLQFTTNVLDILGESFQVEIEGAPEQDAGILKQVSPSQFMHKPGKLLEATVKLRLSEIGTLVPLLLRYFDDFPDDAKKATLEALKEISKA